MQPTPADTRLTRSLARLDACAPCVRPPPVMVTPSHQGRHLQKLTVLNSALHFLTFHCLDFVFTDVSCAREHPHAPVAPDPMLTRAACVRASALALPQIADSSSGTKIFSDIAADFYVSVSARHRCCMHLRGIDTRAHRPSPAVLCVVCVVCVWDD